MSCFLSDGPVPMPNMPNQIMNRMQVPQGMCSLFAFLAVVFQEKALHMYFFLELANVLMFKCYTENW